MGDDGRGEEPGRSCAEGAALRDREGEAGGAPAGSGERKQIGCKENMRRITVEQGKKA